MLCHAAGRLGPKNRTNSKNPSASFAGSSRIKQNGLKPKKNTLTASTLTEMREDVTKKKPKRDADTYGITSMGNRLRNSWQESRKTRHGKQN